MRDDRFTNLEKDIIRTVGRVLSSQEMSDLKDTIFSAVDQVEKATRKTAEKVEEATQKAAQDYRQPSYGRRRYSNQPTNTNYSHNYPTIYRNRKIKGSVGAGVWLGFSIAAVSIMLIALLTSLLIGSVSPAILVFAAASIVSTVLAGKKLSQVSRFRRYLKALGNDPMYTVKEISEKSGVPQDTVAKELPKFVESVSLPYAKLDADQTCLILDQETYQQYLDMTENRRKLEAEEAERKARLAADPNAAAVEQMKKDGMEYLKKIRLSNDALPEQEISDKLDKLEHTCRRIFNYVEQHPNKLPQIRKLMSYYLPMTMKLVESYQQLEKHEASGASVAESKAEIHSALDKINLAFDNLFDRLLENERMDLSADISVLETMLAQEGLTNHTNNINSK